MDSYISLGGREVGPTVALCLDRAPEPLRSQAIVWWSGVLSLLLLSVTRPIQRYIRKTQGADASYLQRPAVKSHTVTKLD